MSGQNQASILYIPHGGGPLPLLGEPGHRELVQFLTTIPERIPRPDAILVISAHWETHRPRVTTGVAPELIYDYYGFPEESYSITYPAPGAPELAEEVLACLRAADFDAQGDDQRGFDHGLFIPLKLMYPAADIPCIQLSMLDSLDPAEHLALGRALQPLRQRNLLVVGSGLSFHNLGLRGYYDPSLTREIGRFQDWLIDTATNAGYDEAERSQRLIDWDQAPGGMLCHPREEHLLPLHVCQGMAGAQAATTVFDGEMMGRRVLGLLW